jgi:UMF1 family MFS transporter
VSIDAVTPAQRVREQRAWYVYDWANSAYVTTTATVLFGPYLTVVAKRAACPGQDTDLACGTALQVLGLPVSPGSLALYTVTAATLLSAVLLPIVGALADSTGRKRELLGLFAWTGAAAAAAMVLVSGDAWQLGVVLQLIATMCLGASLVIYDAFLCEIAAPDERDRVSSRGWALGYLGGGLLLAVNLGMVSAHDAIGLSTEAAVRISLLIAGLWWAVFTIVPYRGLRNRPREIVPGVIGPGVIDGLIDPDAAGIGRPAGARAPRVGRNRPGAVVGRSFRQLGETLRHLRGYPQTWLFLLAYLFYNDGIQTVIYAASIYGQEELGLAEGQLILTILVVQFVAFGGALLFGRVAARIGARLTVLGGLTLWCVVVAIGYLLPRERFLPFLAMAVLIGLVLGGTQALSRSLYSQLVPRGREAEYFSLYQAAERGTSWFGTLLFGLVFQFSGSYRSAIVALVVFFALGGLLLSRVDVRRGIREAGNALPELV